jgi:ABC-2 type transport system ATP-binding protein
VISDMSSIRYGLEKNFPLIEFVSVNKGFDGKKILDGVTLSINRGELFGIIGTSGAGKTTLLKLLIGYYAPDSGKILYNGKDITHDSIRLRRIFGFATQDNCFYEELNVMDNMRYFGKMYGLSGKKIMEKSEYLLKLVGLWNSRTKKAANLSGGMQRRLDLAISIIHEPDILILDEPTSGLDIIIRKKMWALIQQINLMGVTIIMSSHMLDEMEYLCTDIAMIKDGKILMKGSPNQLEMFYSKNEEVHLESYPGNYKKIISALNHFGVQTYYPRAEGRKLIFYTQSAYNVMKHVMPVLESLNETLIGIKIDKPSLDEVFEAVSAHDGSE